MSGLLKCYLCGSDITNVTEEDILYILPDLKKLKCERCDNNVGSKVDLLC